MIAQQKVVCIIDNYDSFTYNLKQYCGVLNAKVEVFRNDEIVAKQIPKNTTHIIISPGPGTPEQAGISNEIINCWAGEIPILGVCLGHQCIGSVFGGTITHAEKIMHGKISKIQHDAQGIYKNFENNIFEVVRYHSLVIRHKDLPDCFNVSAYLAENPNGDIMGIRHKKYPIEGVQFHPEAYYTDYGMDMIANFLLW